MLFLIIFMGLILWLLRLGGITPQMMQLTFLSLLSIGFFYENQKAIISKKFPRLARLGMPFVNISVMGLIITVLVILYLNNGTPIQIVSIFASAVLAIGLFFATKAFKGFMGNEQEIIGHPTLMQEDKV